MMYCNHNCCSQVKVNSEERRFLESGTKDGRSGTDVTPSCKSTEPNKTLTYKFGFLRKKLNVIVECTRKALGLCLLRVTERGFEGSVCEKEEGKEHDEVGDGTKCPNAISIDMVMQGWMKQADLDKASAVEDWTFFRSGAMDRRRETVSQSSAWCSLFLPVL
jgi:hypothetical protein